eukprot:198137_1
MSLVDKVSALIDLIDNNAAIIDDDYSFPTNQGYCHEKTQTRAKGRFTNKTVIITGGAGNFGTSCAYRMASEGCNVALFDTADTANVVQQILSKYSNVKCKSYKVDVTNESVVQQTVQQVVNDFGGIDYLFNNAEYQGQFVPANNYSVKDFTRVMDINVIGAFIVLKYVALAMTQNNKKYNGSVVNTSSRTAIGSQPNMIAYGTSKAAIFHMTRVAAKDLAPYNIRVNSISPALVGPGAAWKKQIESQSATNTVYFTADTKKTAQDLVDSSPLRRYGNVDEVIGPVTFLFSDDSSYLTGVDIPVTGGMN